MIGTNGQTQRAKARCPPNPPRPNFLHQVKNPPSEQETITPTPK